MQTTRTTSATPITFGTAMPGIAICAAATLPLFILQFSMTSTLQIVAFLSLAAAMLSHLAVSNEKSFDAAYLAIKLIAPLQFAFMLWLSVYLGREIAGTSFASSYITSIACLIGITTIDLIISAAALLVVGANRPVKGVSLVTLISAKYAGLLGAIK